MENPDRVSQRMALFIADGAEVLARLDAINQKLNQKLTKILDQPAEKINPEQRFNQRQSSSVNPSFREQAVYIIWISPTEGKPFQTTPDEESPTT